MLDQHVRLFEPRQEKAFEDLEGQFQVEEERGQHVFWESSPPSGPKLVVLSEDWKKHRYK